MLEIISCDDLSLHSSSFPEDKHKYNFWYFFLRKYKDDENVLIAKELCISSTFYNILSSKEGYKDNVRFKICSTDPNLYSAETIYIAPLSESYSQEHLKKKIIGVAPNGKKIIFNSSREAASKLGISFVTISYCLSGKQNSTKDKNNNIWRFYRYEENV